MAEIKKAPEQAKKPWGPSRVLEIPEKFKNPKFTYRWASKGMAGRIGKLRSEGWEIDKELSKLMNGTDHTLADGAKDGEGLDSTTQMRELVVMRLPKVLAKERAAYYASMEGEASDAQDGKDRQKGVVDLNEKGHVPS